MITINTLDEIEKYLDNVSLEIMMREISRYLTVILNKHGKEIEGNYGIGFASPGINHEKSKLKNGFIVAIRLEDIEDDEDENYKADVYIVELKIAENIDEFLDMINEVRNNEMCKEQWIEGNIG